MVAVLLPRPSISLIKSISCGIFSSTLRTNDVMMRWLISPLLYNISILLVNLPVMLIISWRASPLDIQY